MAFRKLSFIEKTLLKLRDKHAYKDYKFLKKLHEARVPSLQPVHKSDVHFKHSGNAGDIIYALPAAYKLAGEGSVHLHLNVDAPGKYKKNFRHPLGSVMLNNKMVDMLRPLLLYQDKIKECSVYTDQQIDFDLDLFREYPLGTGGNIARWYFLVFADYTDLAVPWLKAPVDERFKDSIVISRSFRYRTPGLDYGFLSKYPRLYFAGMPDEYEDMKKMIPNIEHVPVKDFLELATLINSCKLFIGNQSFPFSVAEGLKQTRLLEVSYRVPNVMVEGKGGYDFCYQPQFERIVKKLYEEN